MSRTDGRGDIHHAFRAEETERRIDHILRIGKVVETNYEAVSANGALQARVKVFIDGWPSAWLPIATARNGPNGEWDPPEVDEQVLVWAPSGVTAGAFVWGTIPRDVFPIHPYTERSEDRHLVWKKDDTTFLYDRALHLWEVNNPNAGGKHHFKITDRSEIEQTNDRIFERIANTFIEITDGRIVLSVNGTTSLTITPGLVKVDAARTELTGDLLTEGDIGSEGSIASVGGIATAGDLTVAGNVNAIGWIASASLIAGAKVVEVGDLLTPLVAKKAADEFQERIDDTGGTLQEPFVDAVNSLLKAPVFGGLGLRLPVIALAEESALNALDLLLEDPGDVGLFPFAGPLSGVLSSLGGAASLLGPVASSGILTGLAEATGLAGLAAAVPGAGLLSGAQSLLATAERLSGLAGGLNAQFALEQLNGFVSGATGLNVLGAVGEAGQIAGLANGIAQGVSSLAGLVSNPGIASLGGAAALLGGAKNVTGLAGALANRAGLGELGNAIGAAGAGIASGSQALGTVAGVSQAAAIAANAAGSAVGAAVGAAEDLAAGDPGGALALLGAARQMGSASQSIRNIVGV